MPKPVGRLSQYYSITWIIYFIDDYDDLFYIDTNTTDYQLIGSTLRIPTFPPFVRWVGCRLTTTGVPPFLGDNDTELSTMEWNEVKNNPQ